MKKVFFYLFLAGAIFVFILFSCAKSDCLYDVILSITSNDETLPAGKILCYGKHYENSVSTDTLSEYLGLSGYPDFKDKIEDLAFYSTLNGDYAEIAAIKLYSSDDIEDAKLFFERRIKAVKRARNTSKKSGYASDAYIRTYGNVVVLYMMSDNQRYEDLIKNRI